MNYDFHPEARFEFLDSIDFYESCSEGLGRAFAAEIETTVMGNL